MSSLKGSSGIRDYVSELLSTGSEVFADAAAAVASLDAAGEYRELVDAYISKRYSRPIPVSPAPPGLRELVEKCGGGGAELSAKALVEEAAPAGAMGAGPCSHCAVYLYFDCRPDMSGRGFKLGLHLVLAANSRKDDIIRIELSAITRDGYWLSIPVDDFLAQLGELVCKATALRREPVIPGGKAAALSLVNLAGWLASRSKEKWGAAAADTAARLAAVLSMALAAATYEVPRVYKIHAGVSGYPAIEKAVEEVRDTATEVYSLIARKAASGQEPQPNDVKAVRLWGDRTVWDIAWITMSRTNDLSEVGSSIRYTRSKALSRVIGAVRKAATARTAAEILISISEPG